MPRIVRDDVPKSKVSADYSEPRSPGGRCRRHLSVSLVSRIVVSGVHRSSGTGQGPLRGSLACARPSNRGHQGPGGPDGQLWSKWSILTIFGQFLTWSKWSILTMTWSWSKIGNLTIFGHFDQFWLKSFGFLSNFFIFLFFFFFSFWKIEEPFWLIDLGEIGTPEGSCRGLEGSGG